MISHVMEYKALSKCRYYLPTLYPWKVGEIGYLRYTAIRPREVGVFQVIDKDTMIIEMHPDNPGLLELCWLEGFSTEHLADGDKIAGINALLEITGNKQYGTASNGRTVPTARLEITGNKQYGTAVGGTRTVLVLKPFGLIPQLPDEAARKGGANNRPSSGPDHKIASPRM